jgi:hypothetical protein
MDRVAARGAGGSFLKGLAVEDGDIVLAANADPNLSRADLALLEPGCFTPQVQEMGVIGCGGAQLV